MNYTVTLLLSFWLTAGVVEAQVYKWVDDNGKVHFGDQPPRNKPVAAEKVELKIAPRPTNEPLASEAERVRRQQQLLQTLSQERQQREEKRAKAKVAKERKAALCKRLAAKRDEMLRANAIYTTNENGEREYMDESKGTAYREDLVALYKKECANGG
ncbi:hypothetical protein A3759_10845 [Thalassolituus sp. HI0120]|nr:hypothetical protein A3759_10845 [Thalassolituus sp. HI0120]